MTIQSPLPHATPGVVAVVEEGVVDADIPIAPISAIVEESSGTNATNVVLLDPNDTNDVEIQHQTTATASAYSPQRPALVSATIHKRTQDAKLGLAVRQVDEKIHVSNLSGFFANSPILPGDRIVSINTMTFRFAASVARYIRDHPPGPVTVVVEVDDGDPTMVSSMATKPHPVSRVGIGLKSRSSDNKIVISNIHEDSLLSGSLLNVGDVVLSVNGQDCSDGQTQLHVLDVVGLLRNATDSVTIVTRNTHNNAGVVVSATTPFDQDVENQRRANARQADPIVFSAAGTPNSDEDENQRANARQADKAFRKASVILGIVIALCVLVMIFVFLKERNTCPGARQCTVCRTDPTCPSWNQWCICSRKFTDCKEADDSRLQVDCD